MKLIIICCYIIYAIEAKKSKKPCKQRNCDDLIYKELGCEVMSYDNKKCPNYYQCPNYNIDSGSCRYRGVQYNNGDAVQDANIPKCHFACYCNAIEGFDPMISCAQPSCAFPTCSTNCSDCYPAYQDLNECCPRFAKCASESMATCKLDKNVYKEGELFAPTNSCKICLCQKGFKGKLVEPFCKDINCGIELNYAADLEDSCAPVYHKDACCPDSFLCPDDIPSIKISFPKTRDRSAACYFGCNRIPDEGYFDASFTDRFGNSVNVSCSCTIPPILKCVRV